MSVPLPRKFRTRIMAGTLLVMTIVGLAVILSVRYAMESSLTREAEHRGLLLGQYIGVAAAEAVLSEEPVELLRIQDMMKGLLTSERGLAYGFIVSPGGRILARTFEHGFPQGLLGLQTVKEGEENSIVRVATTDGPMVEYAVPVAGPGTGEVHLGFLQEAIYAEVDRVTRILAVVFTCGFLLSLLFLYGVAGYVTGPIRALTGAARRIAAGDLMARVEHKRVSEEVEELEVTFNRMAESLVETSESLQQANRELEQEISERRRAEESVRFAEKKIRTIWDSAQAGMLVINPEDHRIEDVNRAAADLIGLPAPEIVGRECHRFICPLERGNCPITDRGLNVNQEECHLVTGDGGQVDILKSVVKVKLDGQDYLVESFVDITAQRDLADRLLSSLGEKEVLLREVHHRVKNNLQALSAIIDLQSMRTAEPVLREMLRETRHRIQAMALIHQELYGSEDLSRVDLGRYLENLARNLIQAHLEEGKGVALDMDADPVSLPLDTVIPCGLVVNELVTNALKHAFTGGTNGARIGISLHRVAGDSGYELRVSDNGVGLPEEVSPRSADSMGLRIVSIITAQLGGSLEVARRDGTAFTLTFQEYHEAGPELV